MSYCHLSSQERYVIYHLVLYGLSLPEIGRRLQRHHTTLSHEIKRHRVEIRGRIILFNLTDICACNIGTGSREIQE